MKSGRPEDRLKLIEQVELEQFAAFSVLARGSAIAWSKMPTRCHSCDIELASNVSIRPSPATMVLW
jgi:hypothetical protein